MPSAGLPSPGHARWMRATPAWLVLLLLLVPTLAGAGQAPASCNLLQPAEIEAALGAKPVQFSAVSQGEADLCSGQVGKLKVVIRVARRQGDGTAERQGIDAARRMGAQVDVKTEGDLTCSTVIPPASLAHLGFNTTCSILRAGRVVAVEVTAPSQQEMASMDTVRGLVQKAVARL
jgi:hypothetical protein